MKHSSLAAAAAATLSLAAGSAAAEVSSRTDDGFTLTYERRVDASPDAVLSALARPSAWWSDAHTYSGSAANLRMDLRPGGCWCEDLPGGGVKHAEAVLVWPERNMVRFDAPFGPLQSLGADAVLTVTWAPAPEGQGRLLKWAFVVVGPGAGALADPVEAVMAEQFGRLAEHLSTAA
ncbi:MAG: hypothetical protein A2623_05545 [Caulobacterales bacterium RIFCSPHIGHO2_01_FULL_70_19]|nr:MAG: hypothetical protein A2623_05545 [Caulobacterales bacterium RIFCSPHIGHO2_01_FULL_70_19]